jgi:hypothetical protein
MLENNVAQLRGTKCEVSKAVVEKHMGGRNQYCYVTNLGSLSLRIVEFDKTVESFMSLPQC